MPKILEMSATTTVTAVGELGGKKKVTTPEVKAADADKADKP